MDIFVTNLCMISCLFISVFLCLHTMYRTEQMHFHAWLTVYCWLMWQTKRVKAVDTRYSSSEDEDDTNAPIVSYKSTRTVNEADELFYWWRLCSCVFLCFQFVLHQFLQLHCCRASVGIFTVWHCHKLWYLLHSSSVCLLHSFVLQIVILAT